MGGATKSLVIVMAIAAGIFGGYFCKFVFRISPIDSIIMLFRIIAGDTKKEVSRLNTSMRARTMRMSREEKKKSWRFKYQSMINEILLDMGWKQMGIGIDAITVFALAIAVILSALGFLAMRSIIMTIMLFFSTYVVIIVALFTISRGRHRNRKALIIQAEDMLCASMHNGLIEAVKTNISQFDPEIRDEFQAFLDDINCNMPIVEAIDRLNDRIGSKFDNFCEKAKDFSTNYQPGSEDNFLFNISSNAIETELDNEIYQYAESANMDYFATLGLLVVFFFATNSMYEEMTDFYFKGAGKFLLMFYLMFALAVYVYTQWQVSRRTCIRFTRKNWCGDSP